MHIFPIVFVDPDKTFITKDVMDGRDIKGAIQTKLDVLLLYWEDPDEEVCYWAEPVGKGDIAIITEAGPCEDAVDAQWFAYGKAFRSYGIVCKWRNNKPEPLVGAEAEAVMPNIMLRASIMKAAAPVSS